MIPLVIGIVLALTLFVILKLSRYVFATWCLSATSAKWQPSFGRAQQILNKRLNAAADAGQSHSDPLPEPTTAHIEALTLRIPAVSRLLSAAPVLFPRGTASNSAHRDAVSYRRRVVVERRATTSVSQVGSDVGHYREVAHGNRLTPYFQTLLMGGKLT